MENLIDVDDTFTTQSGDWPDIFTRACKSDSFSCHSSIQLTQDWLSLWTILSNSTLIGRNTMRACVRVRVNVRASFVCAYVSV